MNFRACGPSFCPILANTERLPHRSEKRGFPSLWPGGGGGNLSFQDTGLCHSNRKSTTHKSGEISQKYTHKSGKCTKLLKNIPINLENFLKTTPINPENAQNC